MATFCWQKVTKVKLNEMWPDCDQDPSSLNGLERGIHVEFYTLGGHCGCAGACPRGDSIFVAYERLRMEFERFAHELGNAMFAVSNRPPQKIL